jgi:hypothetical protein
MSRARYLFLALAAMLAASGCNSFLTGPGIDTDPNNPSGLKRPGPLYTAIQALQSVQFEGQLARNALMYSQQIAGNGRQQIGYDRGNSSPADLDTYFNAVYGSARVSTGGGGLLDIRKMQQLARKVNDSLYIGIGKVYEALVMGTAADIWGAVPYREAADSNNLRPHFDPQLQIYQDVLAQLDSAITVYLPASSATNLGPPQDNAEIIYVGRDAAGLAQVYTEVAHSLKARFYMHLAEVDPANYALALAEVPLGIQSPADDMLWFHDTSPTGLSVWWQFMLTRGDIGPGAALIEILKRRIAGGLEDDARLNFYFASATGSSDPADFFGFRPGGAVDLVTAPGVYNGTAPGGNYSGFTFIDPFAGAPGDFRHPVITWAETQLIGAEAAFHAGGQAAAQPYLDAVRANRVYGSTGGQPVTFPALGPVPATLQNIMEEKYVTLFLNMEVWNDYKRTCLPALAPAPPAGSDVPGTSPVPGRMPYGLTETNANPNMPVVSPTGQNANDPNPCPVLDYSTSTPLGN